MHKVSILSFVLICLIACSKNADKQEGMEQNKKKNTFTSFKLDNFKAIKASPDIGLMKLFVFQYQFPKVEVHSSYQKYIRFETAGDTLFIFAQNTPRNTDKHRTLKEINIYVPDLDFLESEVSQVLIRNFNTKTLKVVNKSSSIRFMNCRIQHALIENQESSSCFFDSSNILQTIELNQNEKSTYQSRAKVLEKFVVNGPSLEKVLYSNIPKNAFFWNKK